MTRTQRGLRTILKAIARSSERSSLFWWMFDHHDQLIAAARGQRMRWSPLCDRFAALGLVDATGKPASIRTAWETWRQVRAAVASARAHAAAQAEQHGQGRVVGLVNPSRMSPNWRPQVVPPGPPATSQAHSAAVLSNDSAGTSSAPASVPPSSSAESFSTIGPDGTPLEPGWVFYRGRVMRESTAEQVANFNRLLEQEDRFR